MRLRLNQPDEVIRNIEIKQYLTQRSGINRFQRKAIISNTKKRSNSCIRQDSMVSFFDIRQAKSKKVITCLVSTMNWEVTSPETIPFFFVHFQLAQTQKWPKEWNIARFSHTLLLGFFGSSNVFHCQLTARCRNGRCFVRSDFAPTGWLWLRQPRHKS